MGSSHSKDNSSSSSTAAATATTATTATTAAASAPHYQSSPKRQQQDESASASASAVRNPKTTSNNEENENENENTNSQCPMHRGDGTYSYDWRALFKPSFPHGPKGGSKPLTKDEVQERVVRPDTVETNNNEDALSSSSSSSSSCPVRHNDDGSGSGSGGCPVRKQQAANRQYQYPEYNVYSQPIVDPNNRMPKNPNQLPAPQQTKELSTDRVASTIPKGGGAAAAGSTHNNKTWTYPSPQMFYNALARKGKLLENNENSEIQDDIESVVHIHNHMNEKTWRKILQWESAASAAKNASGADSNSGRSSAPPPPQPTPKLLRFQGRPGDLSPKARFKHHVFGHPLPYDRHDWIIEREDGTTVRYVIDYYHDDNLAQTTPESARPDIRDIDTDATPSLLVDVRPALDSVSSIWHRIFAMPYARHVSHATRFEPLPLLPSASMKSQVPESVAIWQSIQQQQKQQQQKDGEAEAYCGDDAAAAILPYNEEEAGRLANSFARVLSECREEQVQVDRCDDDSEATECAKASLDLNLCMGRILCPLQHQALLQQLHNNNDDDDSNIEEALARVSACIAARSQQHKNCTGRRAK